MRVLVATPDRNSLGKHAHDWQGAFDPEARAFLLRHGGRRIQIDMGVPPSQRQRDLIGAIEHDAPEVFAWIGHGLPHSIPQLGLDDAAEVAALTAALAAGCSAPVVLLYACSTAGGAGTGGEGGIADRIRDALVSHGARGCRVYGHSTAGHATENPYLRVFAGPDVTPAQEGGQWVVEPHSRLWLAWCRAMRGPTRLDFWTLSDRDLEARVVVR